MAQRALVQEFTAGVTLSGYLADRKLQLAVERLLEIIGEAARNLSDSAKNDFPTVPWRAIVAQRNVLAHDYGDIKQERLWKVVIEHIPNLLTVLGPVVPPPPGAQR